MEVQMLEGKKTSPKSQNAKYIRWSETNWEKKCLRCQRLKLKQTQTPCLFELGTKNSFGKHMTTQADRVFTCYTHSKHSAAHTASHSQPLFEQRRWVTSPFLHLFSSCTKRLIIFSTNAAIVRAQAIDSRNRNCDLVKSWGGGQTHKKLLSKAD